MTDQRELDRLLRAFFIDGTDQVADRVIDAALDQIDHTRQRRALRMPRRFQTMPMFLRLAAAALIGVLAISGALFVFKPSQSSVVGLPSPTVSPTPTATPAPTPTARPSLSASLSVARQIQTATTLADGRVLVAGGYDPDNVYLASADVFDPATGMFSPTGPMTTPRGWHTATLLRDGRVLVAGGGIATWLYDGMTYIASAELYDPSTGTFTAAGRMTTPRMYHTATLLRDGRVLIVGGNDVGAHALASAEIYDPSTGMFTATGSMKTARGFHTATLLADGRVLIAAGDAAAWNDSGPFLASAEIYDPATGTFTPTGSLANGRAQHAATLLADGRVLVTGGTPGQPGNNGSGTVSLASAEIYDPATGKFTRTGSMTVGRCYQTETLLPDGRVLVTGGLPKGRVYENNPEFLASAELYDPTTGKFTATGSMADRRTLHTASMLADGRVLVTGGYGDLAPLASAELYDPRTGTFSPAGGG